MGNPMRETALNDFAAVHNALLLPWSSGQVEGQIKRLTFIKRQMYGPN
jgi:transposase